jgi:putative acetyltransferase
MKHLIYVLSAYLHQTFTNKTKIVKMIRSYRETDLEDIMTIWYEAQHIAHPFLSTDFVDDVKIMMIEKFIPDSKTWVYEDQGQIVGFIAMMNNEIGGLFISPNEQSKGIGGLLLTYVSKFHDQLEVEVFDKNNIGKPFYLKQGFKTSSEYFHEITNQKVLRMQRDN